MNNYAKELNDVTANKRLERCAIGVCDQDVPPTPSTPEESSPTGDLEIDLGVVCNLFGETDTGGRLRRLVPTYNGRRMLQDDASEEEQENSDFEEIEIDVNDFMSFDLVRG